MMSSFGVFLPTIPELWLNFPQPKKNVKKKEKKKKKQKKKNSESDATAIRLGLHKSSAAIIDEVFTARAG